MKHKILNNNQIIQRLIDLSDSKTASELARKLGTVRQNLKSYENKKTTDLNNKIISLLLDFIDKS